MSCRETQNRLQDWLDGTLSAEAQRSVQAHVDGCSDCREVAALLRMDLAQGGASPDLTAAVLERTSGSACVRAEEILCDHVDDTLQAVDTELLTLHFESCDGCASTASALARLAQILPTMATLEPAGDFVGDVLAATSARPRPWADLGARWARTWAGLLERPRIAWELGYIGGMALWLVVGTFGAPLLAARPPLPSRDASARFVESVQGRVTDFGQKAWSATGGQGLQAWQGFKSGVTDRYQGTAAAREGVRVHSAQLKDAALGLDFEQSGQALRELSKDAQSVWLGMASSPADEEITNE